MKSSKTIYKKLLTYIFSLYFLFIASLGFAEEEQKYTETKTDFGTFSGDNAFTEYVVAVFNWGSRIIELIAILMIVYAGYRYITSTGNPEQAQKAKNIIITAIASLLLVILAKLILHTINPNINVPIV